MASANGDSGVTQISSFVLKASDDAKLRAVLSNLNSTEARLCSLASKDFVNLINGENGGAVLFSYVRLSVDFSELKSAWKLRHEKSNGLCYVLKVVYAVLNHPEGKYVRSDDRERLDLSKRIDKLASFVIEEKLQDIYGEIKSKEGKRQSAALLVLGAVVRRGSGLASQVANVFDFKIPYFSKLAEVRKRKDSDKKVKHKTRKSYVWFAMSFLDVGKPALLRWVLRQRDVFYSILRGLSNDDDDTIEYVLTTLRDRVLTPESLLPPSLRSVLFGSNTLEQLINISGRDGGGSTVELCHEVLVMVCTDPCNGLMPDLGARPNPLQGNRKRLLDLMKKLKATEVDYHKALLLSVFKGRPSLASAYLDEFPYNFEDHASPNWSAAALLAANLVSSVGTSLSLSFLDSQSHEVITFDSPDIQSILKCISPRSFSRSIINKGLLHSNFSVKHGTLRLLLEVLRLLDYFLCAIDVASWSNHKNKNSLTSLKQDIVNEVRLLLPDPQVILTLLSTLGSQSRDHGSCSKRAADTEILAKQNRRTTKKPKCHNFKEDTDILVAGIIVNDNDDISLEEETDEGTESADGSRRKEHSESGENWWLERCSIVTTASKDEEIYLQSKLLEAVKFYLRILPDALESSFDFFVNFLVNASSLPTYFLQSLMSLLVQYTSESRGSKAESKTMPPVYKHLQTFINLMIFSPIIEIRKQAYAMAQSALLSTGAFDNNLSEIQAWFLFIPGFYRGESLPDSKEIEALRNFTSVVSSFLCDAISTVGNNLFKYWDLLRDQIHRIKDVEDISPTFSPLIPCIFQKCLRLLYSGSGTFTYPGKSMIALYVCNTLKYILQTQVDSKLFAAWIDLVLPEGLEYASHAKNESAFCKWRPVRDLWNFSKRLSMLEAHTLFDTDMNDMHFDPTFVTTLNDVKKIVGVGEVKELGSLTEALCASTIGTSSSDILSNFPTTMEVIGALLEVPLSLLSSIFFLHRSLLVKVFKSWPDIFAPALESVTSVSLDKEIKNVARNANAHSLLADRTSDNLPTDSKDSTAATFGLFLDLVPFHIVFPLFMSIDGLQLMDQFKLNDWFLRKLSKCSLDLLVPNLRILLFWFYKIQSYSRTNASAELVRLSEICFVVIENLLDQIWDAKREYEFSTWLEVLLSKKILLEVAESVLSHPYVINSLELIFDSGGMLTKQVPGDLRSDFLFSDHYLNGVDAWSSGVFKVDDFSIRILKKTSDKLLSLYDDSLCVREDDANMRNLHTKINVIRERLLRGLKNKIDVCIQSGDPAQVVSTIHVFHALKQLISPSELLGLACWVLNRVSKKDLSTLESHRSDVHVVCFHIACDIFETLGRYWDQPKSEGISYWQVRCVDNIFDARLLEVYFRVLDMTSCVEVEIVDMCLLKAIKLIYMLQRKTHHKILSLSLTLSKAVASTPGELVSHCIQGITMTKAKLLFLLTELSPLHLSMFGDIFMGIANGNVIEEDIPRLISTEELLMLLPTALSYINWSIVKFGMERLTHLTSILSLYSGVILNGFASWNSFVAGYVFQEDYNELTPFSSQELLNLCCNSLLGKTVTLLQYCCTSADSSIGMKKRLKLFDSVCSHSPGQDELLGCDITELESYSSCQLTNFLCKVMSKTLFCKLMVFPDCFQGESSQLEENGKRKDSTKMKTTRLRFVEMLMKSWCLTVTASASRFAKSGNNCSGTNLLLKQFEVFILRTFVESVEKTRDSVIQLHSIPFLEQFFKTSLLYRFEDTATLTMLRTVLTLLSEGTYSSDLFLQLLLSHSHFVSAMHIGFSATEHRQAGVFAGQMSSILRAVSFTNDVHDKADAVMYDHVSRKLEVIKLLRLLVHLSFRNRGHDSGKHIEINIRELFLLLLSSYGATLSEVDLEIYSLMNDIERFDGLDYGNISEMDYMWGSAARMVKQNKEHEVLASCIENDEEAKGWRRTQFRENVLYDPKLSLITLLNFPHNRTASTAELNACEFNVDKVHVRNLDNIKGYDPVFILRFSIHILTVGYVEPLEFTSLGLLPMAFVSISSPDEGIRELGYETLRIFQNALEKSQNRKDVIRLRLLLTCVQNSIEERLQPIPSVIAIFAAEASMTLLDATNDHYSDIVEFLMSSSALKMKRVPLFDKFFWSSSLTFKKERVWILRLCYKGLQLKEDAQIYIRSSVLENILSYYSSPFADDDSKLLILQILKKAAKLHRTARHLVGNCSLLPWLSHRVSHFSDDLVGDKITTLRDQLILVCEIVMEIMSSRNLAEWLQNQSLEQLSELSSHLFRLLLNGEVLVREHVDLVDSILQILTLTEKISQKRNIYQPHFTLSVDGLFQIYKIICHKDSGCGSTAEFGLKAILMSTPPVAVTRMMQEKLSEFVMWAISTAISLDSMQVSPRSTSDPQLTLASEELHEDSITSKLLRWLSASVILAKISGVANKGTLNTPVTPDYKSLQSLLECIQQAQNSPANSPGSEDTLATMIFYLYHYLLRHNCRVAQSAIAALCILLVPKLVADTGSKSVNPVDYGIHVAPLVSKIQSPPEANPKWRWTFYQPWEDRTSTPSDSEKLEEFEACKMLLRTTLNVLEKRSLDSQS
ncbi:hypothetical protein QQ045_001411 [Rhodiola kirilowii]